MSNERASNDSCFWRRPLCNLGLEIYVLPIVQVMAEVVEPTKYAGEPHSGPEMGVHFTFLNSSLVSCLGKLRR